MTEIMLALTEILRLTLQLGVSPAGQQAALNVLTPVKGNLEAMLAAQQTAPEPKE